MAAAAESVSAVRAGLGVAPPAPAPHNTPRVGRGSPSPWLVVQTPRRTWRGALDARDRGGDRARTQVWFSARRLQTPLSPPGLLQFSFAFKQGQHAPAPHSLRFKGSHPTPLCGLFSPAPRLPPCCPCAYAGCGPSTLTFGSSQRPPGSGESGPRDQARLFSRFLLLACPILGAGLGAGIALCQAPYRFVGLLSPSLLKTQYQRLRDNP